MRTGPQVNVQKVWIGGASTRRADERVGAFPNRPLTGDRPYVWLDATYLKMREAGRIVSAAAIRQAFTQPDRQQAGAT